MEITGDGLTVMVLSFLKGWLRYVKRRSLNRIPSGKYAQISRGKLPEPPPKIENKKTKMYIFFYWAKAVTGRSFSLGPKPIIGPNRLQPHLKI